MPAFGARSLEILATVDPAIIEVCHAVIPNYDFSVLPLGGFRTREQQDELVDAGKSQTRWPTSKHNVNRQGRPHAPGIAIDIAPYPINWEDTYRFIQLSGYMHQAAGRLGYELRWGGNWDGDQVIINAQNFNALVHYELIKW